MKRNSLFILSIGIITVFGCVRLMTPKPKSFLYYNKGFDLSKHKTLLRTDGMYVKATGKIKGYAKDFCEFLIFFNDGLVRKENTTCDLSYNIIMEIKKEVFGYYTLKGDSIFFTTKSFYNKNANLYFGKIYKDSLITEVTIGINKKIFKETYYFQPDWYVWPK